VLLHHAIASSRLKSPDFLRFVGIGISPRDDPKTPWRVVSNVTFTLVNLKPGHYITSHDVTYDRTVEYRSPDSPDLAGKFPALDLPDTEVFLNQQFTDGREKTVLYGFRLEDPQKGTVTMQDRAGWLKPAGKGWIFYFQPGHAEADFKNRNYCQIVWNCLTWKPEVKPAAP
jgi:type 1 glutamine amidotransferase